MFESKSCLIYFQREKHLLLSKPRKYPTFRCWSIWSMCFWMIDGIIAHNFIESDWNRETNRIFFGSDCNHWFYRFIEGKYSEVVKHSMQSTKECTLVLKTWTISCFITATTVDCVRWLILFRKWMWNKKILSFVRINLFLPLKPIFSALILQNIDSSFAKENSWSCSSCDLIHRLPLKS